MRLMTLTVMFVKSKSLQITISDSQLFTVSAFTFPHLEFQPIELTDVTRTKRTEVTSGIARCCHATHVEVDPCVFLLCIFKFPLQYTHC